MINENTSPKNDTTTFVYVSNCPDSDQESYRQFLVANLFSPDRVYLATIETPLSNSDLVAKANLLHCNCILLLDYDTCRLIYDLTEVHRTTTTFTGFALSASSTEEKALHDSLPSGITPCGFKLSSKRTGIVSVSPQSYSKILYLDQI